MSLVKLASIWDSALSIGKNLIKIPTVKNALIGAGTGAVAGALTSSSGNRLSGALKGAAIGGVGAGVGTVAKNTIQSANRLYSQGNAAAKVMGSKPLGYGTQIMQSTKQQVGKLQHQVSGAINPGVI